MSERKLILCGIVYMVVQFLITAHVFVTFPELSAYAASKDSVVQILDRLERIEHKIDKLILGY